MISARTGSAAVMLDPGLPAAIFRSRRRLQRSAISPSSKYAEMKFGASRAPTRSVHIVPGITTSGLGAGFFSCLINSVPVL
jgi:hypothetical protein